MKKRLLPLILACVFFLISVSGCKQEKKIPELVESETPPVAASYKTMSLKNGELEITRNDVGSTPMGEDGSWTIFVYMSGSTLETQNHSGSKDLDEMRRATARNSEDSENIGNTGNVRFVVQTGGSTEWRYGDLSSEKLLRHVIENGERQTVAQLPLASMGEAATLRNFVEWGIENYPAEKMGLVLWGHGRGLGGVCKDDLFDGDYLELSEINAALSEAYSETSAMTDKFEFIGFDACYMATLETADICASYARYMIGSEELEPTDGWDYAALGEVLSKEPDADWEKLSEIFCESFLAASEESEHASRVTLSVIDLSKLDDLLVELNGYSRELCGELTEREELRELRKTLEAGEHFGNGTIVEGYSNRLDLGDLIRAGADIADASKITGALENAVIRKSNASGHPNASGLTLYFPLETKGTEELRVVAGVVPCPYYVAFIEAMMLSASPAFDSAKPNNRELAALCVGEIGKENGALCEYWSDLGENAMGGNTSGLIKTSGNFSIDSSGKYKFSITPETLCYAKSVGVRVFRRLGYDEEDEVELCNSYGVMTAPSSDWENGEFSGTVNGRWIMFPNKEPLEVKPYEITDDGVTYVSNIRLDIQTKREEKGIAISADKIGWVSLEGYWKYGEDGKHTLQAIPLGSTCIPYRYYYIYGGEVVSRSLGNKIIFENKPRVICDMLNDGDYCAVLEITDVRGDIIRSEIRDFSITEGRIAFIG